MHKNGSTFIHSKKHRIRPRYVRAYVFDLLVCSRCSLLGTWSCPAEHEGLTSQDPESPQKSPYLIYGLFPLPSSPNALKKEEDWHPKLYGILDSLSLATTHRPLPEHSCLALLACAWPRKPAGPKSTLLAQGNFGSLWNPTPQKNNKLKTQPENPKHP